MIHISHIKALSHEQASALGEQVPFCKCMLTDLVLLWQVRQKAAAMMFIELMFWKNAPVAESVRDEYKWRVSLLLCCLSLA